MTDLTLHPPRLCEIGAAAGILAILLFGLLALLTVSAATAVVGCGFGALLLIASLVAGRSFPATV